MEIKGLQAGIDALCALKRMCQSSDALGFNHREAEQIEAIITNVREQAVRENSPFLHTIADAIDEGLIHISAARDARDQKPG
jgi:hypothetical protein